MSSCIIVVWSTIVCERWFLLLLTSTSQRAVMLCGWRVKAGMVLFAGKCKTVWSMFERIRGCYDNALYKSTYTLLSSSYSVRQPFVINITGFLWAIRPSCHGTEGNSKHGSQPEKLPSGLVLSLSVAGSRGKGRCPPTPIFWRQSSHFSELQSSFQSRWPEMPGIEMTSCWCLTCVIFRHLILSHFASFPSDLSFSVPAHFQYCSKALEWLMSYKSKFVITNFCYVDNLKILAYLGKNTVLSCVIIFYISDFVNSKIWWWSFNVLAIAIFLVYLGQLLIIMF